MPKRNEGPAKNKQTGYYYMDEQIGFPPNVKRFRYSLKTREKEIAVERRKKECRKLWGEYYRLTLPEKPHVDWQLFHPNKKPWDQMSKEERIKEGSKKTSIKNSGEYHPRWQGGVSFGSYGPEFNNKLKARIRKRDKYTCAVCKKLEDGKSHTVHHVDYNKKNNDPKNLISVCANCHSQTNINREVWTNFFMSLSEIRSIQRKAKKLSA